MAKLEIIHIFPSRSHVFSSKGGFVYLRKEITFNNLRKKIYENLNILRGQKILSIHMDSAYI